MTFRNASVRNGRLLLRRCCHSRATCLSTPAGRMPKVGIGGPDDAGTAARQEAALSSKWARARAKVLPVAALVAKKPTSTKKPARSKAQASRVSGKHIFSSSYLYFVLLERSWWFCIMLSLSAYLFAILLCALLAATATIINGKESLEIEHGISTAQWELCFRFAAAHIITMGGGDVHPLDTWGYVLAWLQQVLGILVNVVIFTAVLAKFTAPQSDLVWSEVAVVRKRDSVPHFLVRVGNLRCHTLYSPSIRLTLLRQHKTQEGEKFFRRYDLEVDQPATVSGIHTVAHAITAESPLAELLESGALRASMDAAAAVKPGKSRSKTKSERLSIHAVIQAFDNVYGSDLSATTTFSRGSVHFDASFADMLTTVNGKQSINWDAFNVSVPLTAALRLELSTQKLSALKRRAHEVGVDRRRLEEADDEDDIKETVISLILEKLGPQASPSNHIAPPVQPDSTVAIVERSPAPSRPAIRSDANLRLTPAPTVAKPSRIKAQGKVPALLNFSMEGDPEPAVPPTPGRPYLSCGSARASYGEKGGVLDAGAPRSPLMPYCPYCLRLMLLLSEGGAEYETIKIDSGDKQEWYAKLGLGFPAVWGRPGGPDDTSWVGESQEIRARWVAAHKGVARANVLRSPVSEEEVHRMGDVLLFGGIVGRMVGTREAKATGMAKWMLCQTVGTDAAEALVKAIADAPEGESEEYVAAVAAARQASEARLLETLEKVAQLLSEAEGRGGFLGGATPDPADCVLVTAAWAVKAVFDSGLATVDNATGGLSAAGFGTLENYVQRWCARSSWEKVFGSSDAFNANIVREFANMMGKATDVCPPESLRRFCLRARHMCPMYRAMLKAQGKSPNAIYSPAARKKDAMVPKAEMEPAARKGIECTSPVGEAPKVQVRHSSESTPSARPLEHLDQDSDDDDVRSDSDSDDAAICT
jgi:glutathione S-transferase